MKKIKKFNIRTDVYYDTAESYWVDVNGNTARIGMSPLVQETSGSFVAISINDIGTSHAKGASFGSVEAEKHVGHLKMPVSGKITAVNEKALANPRLLNSDPYGKGWLIEIEMSDFQAEKANLLSGESKIVAWFTDEINKYEEKGWLAEL